MSKKNKKHKLTAITNACDLSSIVAGAQTNEESSDMQACTSKNATQEENEMEARSIAPHKVSSKKKLTSLELASKIFAEGEFRLYNNDIYIFDGQLYKLADTAVLMEFLASILTDAECLHLSANNLKDGVEMFSLRFKCKIKEAKINNRTILFNNGYYDLRDQKFIKRTSDDFVTFKVDANFYPDKKIKTPVFKNFVQNVTDGDEDLKKLLYEFLGYVLLQENNIKTFFLIGGARNSGKTTFCRLIEKLIGKSHISHVELHKFENGANLMALTGKVLNVQYDSAATIVKNQSIFSFNSYVDDNEYCAKCIIEAYQPLKLQKSASLFWDIMTVIPFLKSATEENKNLINELWAERDGIIQKAVKGAQRLIKNNYAFTYCYAAELFKRQLEHSEVATIGSFVEKCCVIDFNPDTRTHTAELYDVYCEFCDDNYIDAVTENAFSRSLKGAYGLKTFRCKNGGQRPLHGFEGICLKDAN